MSSFSIGQLRHRLTLEQLDRTADGGGGATESWVEVAELWAAIRPLSGDEQITAERMAGRISYEIVLRYRAGVAPAMRLRTGTRVFQIAAVIDVEERRAWLKCLCTEGDL